MILVLNSGSATLKFSLIDPATGERRGGLIERIGAGGPPDHRAALGPVLAEVDRRHLHAVGHRVVHGGASLVQPVVIDDGVLRTLHDLIPLAPLHNPGAIAGIEAARTVLPDVPQVAVFDTAFHADLPAAAATYAIDADVADRYAIRRYGFHGISYRFVAARTAELLGRPLSELHLVVLHLGNGASAAAIQSGQSIDTSMGFTPLEGLVMGTRSGDLDPAIVTYLQRAGRLARAEVDELLQQRSGLAGLCGHGDVRDALAARAAGDRRAALALDVYCHRIRKYVGAYHALLGRLDAIVFTAGVGEHAPAIRAESLSGLDGWGIRLDPDRNATGTGPRVISPDGAPVAVCVVPTDEELAIAEEAGQLVTTVTTATVTTATVTTATATTATVTTQEEPCTSPPERRSTTRN